MSGDRPTCQLCGVTPPTRYDLETRPVAWRDPEEIGEPFGTVLRCKDRAACRRTVELAGEEWPIRDTPNRL